MFFAPVLAVVAATGISSTYAAAIPAVTQQVSNSAAINLEDYLTEEQKQAGLGGLVKSMGPTILGLVTSFIPGMFAGGKDQKRDLEGLEELMRRSFDGLSEEEKQAKFSAILKGIAPALAGVAASFLPGLFSSGQQKRDLEGFEELMRRSFDGLSEEEKQARFSAILKGIAPALAGVAASFLPGLFSSGQQKRDVVDIDSMNDEEKKAFWGALAGVAASLLGGVIGGKRDVVDVDSMNDEEKKAFWGALAGVAASFLGGVLGKRDVDINNLSEEDKQAFIPALIGVLGSVFGGLVGGRKRDVDINTMDDEEKKAFWGALAGVAASFLGGVLGKRDVDINTMDDEEKKAFWGALAGVAASFLGGILGKRDVELSEEDKQAFIPALIGVLGSVFGGLVGGRKRDLDFDSLDAETKQAVIINLLSEFAPQAKQAMRRDAAEILYARDAGFADAFFAEEF